MVHTEIVILLMTFIKTILERFSRSKERVKLDTSVFVLFPPFLCEDLFIGACHSQIWIN